MRVYTHSTVDQAAVLFGSSGRYQIVDLLGSDEYGQTWCARDSRTGQGVLIRRIPNENFHTQGRAEGFLVNTSRALGLRHPGLAELNEFGCDEDGFFIVTECIRGIALDEWLKEERGLDPARAAETVALLADALHHAHSQGVIHGALTTHSVILDSRPASPEHAGLLKSGWHPRLDGFGLGWASAANRTPTRIADIRALGMILRDLSPDATAHEDRADQELRGQEQIEDASGLEAIIQKSYSYGYATAADFANALRCFLAGGESQAAPLAPGQPGRIGLMTKLGLPLVAGVSILVLGKIPMQQQKPLRPQSSQPPAVLESSGDEVVEFDWDAPEIGDALPTEAELAGGSGGEESGAEEIVQPETAAGPEPEQAPELAGGPATPVLAAWPFSIPALDEMTSTVMPPVPGWQGTDLFEQATVPLGNHSSAWNVPCDWAKGFVASGTDAWSRLVPRKPIEQASNRLWARMARLLGNISLKRGRHAEALGHYRRSLDQLGATAPANASRVELANGSYNLGTALTASGQLAEARQSFDLAHALWSDLREEYKTSCGIAVALAQTENNLGCLSLAAGELSLARRNFARALELRRFVVEQQPDNQAARNELAQTEVNLGCTDYAAGGIEQAIDHFSRAVTIRKLVADAAPDNFSFQSDLATTLDKLGLALESAGQTGRARNYWIEAVRYERRAHDLDPPRAAIRCILSERCRRAASLALD